MLADPQTVTVNAVAQNLPAITRMENKSIYRKDDESYTLTVSHAEGKRDRRVIRLDRKKTAADPFAAGVNVELSNSYYLVIDTAPWGFTLTEKLNDVLGLTAWMTSPVVTKVLGGES